MRNLGVRQAFDASYQLTKQAEGILLCYCASHSGSTHLYRFPTGWGRVVHCAGCKSNPFQIHCIRLEAGGCKQYHLRFYL